MKSILICSLIFNIIYLFILCYIVSLENNNRYIYKYITYNDIKSDLKSGDLLLFSNQQFTLVPRILGDLTFSHVALIVKKDYELYSLEIVDNDIIYRNKNKMDGVIIVPLKDRLLNYSGYIYVASLVKPLTLLQQEKLYKFNISNCRFLKWTDLYNFFYIFSKESNIKMCSQFIVNILEELEIITNNNPYYFWKYYQILINLCNDNIYKHPVFIIPNDLIIKKLSYNKKICIN